MRIHRFYIKSFKGSINNEINISTQGGDTAENELNEALIHQWCDIFRMKTGDGLAIFNGEEGEWYGEFTSLDKKKGAIIKLIEQTEFVDESMPKSKISLYIAIIKNSNFDLVVEKATELGVSHIIPITTERTVKANLNFYRLNRLAIEATEQSGRISPPEIHEIMDLEAAISHAKANCGQLLFGHIGDSAEATKTSSTVALFIGPEGGWAENEVLLFGSEGMLPVSLGQFVLRAETAAIIGVSKLS